MQEIGCGVISLGETWCDTTTDVGRLVMTIMGGIAEFERNLIRKRCEEGILRAKQNARSALAGWTRSQSTPADRRALLPARQWLSWPASTSAAKRRFGGHYKIASRSMQVTAETGGSFAGSHRPLIIVKLEDHDIRAPILGMGVVMAISRCIPVLVKATTNRHDLPRMVLF